MKVRRISRRGKYYVAVWDSAGKFSRFFKWKRSDPSTWVKNFRAEVEEPIIEEEIKEEGEYWKTVIGYECADPPTYSSWHIDLTKVSEANTEFGSIQEQEDYCFEYLARAFKKVLLKKEAVLSRDWVRDLSKYEEYPYLQEILENIGVEFVTTVEQDGMPEEVLELWRCKT